MKSKMIDYRSQTHGNFSKAELPGCCKKQPANERSINPGRAQCIPRMVLGEALGIEHKHFAEQRSFQRMSEFENSQNCFLRVGKEGRRMKLNFLRGPLLRIKCWLEESKS